MPPDAPPRQTGVARRLRLIDDPDESWRAFGREDPYFGVLSVDRYRAANLDQAALKDFFATGERHVADVLNTLRAHFGERAMQDALDFGCGVGRLVLPLARRYGSVTGIDISEDYIAEAARNAAGEKLTNVRFVQTPGALAPGSFDLVHSCIVFNHIPWPKGKILIGQLFGLLRPKGVMALQVLHRRRAGPARRLISWARRNFLPLHWLINLGRGRPVFEPLMQGNEYPLDELLPYLRQLGAGDFLVRIEPQEAGGFFAFVFCAKPGKGPEPGR